MADVNLTITIPDAQVTRVFDTFTKLADRNIILRTSLSPIEPGGREPEGSWVLKFSSKLVSETNKQFGIRAILETIRALVKLKEYTEDTQRYHNDVSVVIPPSQNVPDNIVLGS